MAKKRKYAEVLDRHGQSGVWWALRIGKYRDMQHIPYLLTDSQDQPMLFRSRENARYHAAKGQIAVPLVLCERRRRAK